VIELYSLDSKMDKDFDMIIIPTENITQSNATNSNGSDVESTENSDEIEFLPTVESYVKTTEDFRKSFSEIVLNIYLGDEYQAHDIDLLRKNNIKGILCLNHYEKNPDILKKYKHSGITHRHITIMDTSNSNITKYLSVIYTFIDSFIKTEQNVYVHCQNGISRSATAVIYYIMRKCFETTAYKGLNKTGKILDIIINFVRKKRYIIEPNPGFYRVLKNQESLYIEKYVTQN